MHEAGEPEQHGKQEQPMDDAGKPGSAASFDVYDGPDIRARAWKPSDQGCAHVANALTDQLSVAVVMGLGEAVGEQRAEQRVNCAKQGELNRRRYDERDLVECQLRNDQCWQASRNGADPWRVHPECNRARGHHYERYQSGWYFPGEPRQDLNDREGDHAHQRNGPHKTARELG